MKSYRAAFFSLFLLVLLLFPAPALLGYPPGPWAEGSKAPTGKGSPLIEVRDDRLTVKIYGVPWGAVLRELERQTGLAFHVQGSLDGTVTEVFEALPVEEGLRRLLRGADFIFLYAGTKAEKGAESRLVQVWILPRKAGGAAETAQTSPRSSQGAEDSLGLLVQKALGAETWEKRDEAVGVLGDYKDPRVREVLIQALQDPDENVRESAVDALAGFKEEAVIDRLSKALVEDTSEDVRESAVDALGEVAGPRAIEALAGALQDESVDVRESAAYALGQIGGERAIEALRMVLLHDGDGDVRETAKEALHQLKAD